MQRKNKFVRQFCDFVERYEILIFILIGVAVLRLPTLFEPNRYADEDIYLVLGQGLRKGLVFYRDIHDNKPPLLYLMAAVAGNVMWFRLILMIWNLVNVAVIWKLAERLIKKKWLVTLVTVLFGIFSSVPLIEGNIANGEIFMIMPITGAVLLLVTSYKLQVTSWRYFWVGILFAIGFLFKVPVFFDMVGVGFWLIVYRAKGIAEVIKKIFDRKIWLLLVGFLTPVLLSIAYYFVLGAGEVYLRSALGQNIGYLASWGGSEVRPFYESGLFQRGLAVVVWMVGLWLMRKRLGYEFGLVGLWLVMALFGANLSGRPYPHYMIQILVPGSLLIGLMLVKKDLWKWVVGRGLMVTVGLTIWKYDYWYYQSWPYYENFARYVIGDKSRVEYESFWGEGVLRNERIAKYIRLQTDKDERIFVWGTEPAIYALSERLPVGRYTVAYHIKDFDGWKETMEAIKKYEPKVIVIDQNEEKFEELNSYVSALYTEVMREGGVRVFRRIL